MRYFLKIKLRWSIDLRFETDNILDMMINPNNTISKEYDFNFLKEIQQNWTTLNSQDISTYLVALHNSTFNFTKNSFLLVYKEFNVIRLINYIIHA